MAPAASTILLDTQYLPNIEYMATAIQFGHLLWEQHEHYAKQSYRNRCRILTAQGPMDLVIPVRHHATKMKMKDFFEKQIA